MSFPPVPNTEIRSDNMWLSWFRRIREIFVDFVVVTATAITLRRNTVIQGTLGVTGNATFTGTLNTVGVITATAGIQSVLNTNGTLVIQVVNGNSGSGASARLQASNGTNALIAEVFGTGFTGGANQGWLYTSGAHPLILGTNSAERMRIDGTGWVTVNSTTRSGIGAGTDQFAVNGNIGFIRQLNGSPGTNNPLEIVSRSTTSPIDMYPSNVFVASFKPNGAVRFIPLASAPASPQAGDTYYDGPTNKLRCFDGSIWNNLF